MGSIATHTCRHHWFVSPNAGLELALASQRIGVSSTHLDGSARRAVSVSEKSN